MKNTGLVIAIVVATVALSAGGYFLMQDKLKSQNAGTRDINFPEINNVEKVKDEVPPEPTETEMKSGAGVDIDTELKNLDKDMGSAFDVDSDSDPTTGI